MLHVQLRKARERQGISQEKLAKLAGVGRSLVQKAEDGTNITIETLTKLLPHLSLQSVVIGDVAMAVEEGALRFVASEEKGASADPGTPTTYQEFREWLAEGREAGQKYAAEILALRPSQWERWLSQTPAAQSPHTFFALLDAARGLVDRDLEHALAVANMVLFWTDILDPHRTAKTAGAIAGPVLRGRAWAERGQMLREADAPELALQAFDRATEILSDPALKVERFAASRGAAVVRHQLGATAEALHMLRSAIRVLHAEGDLRNALLARVDEAAIVAASGEKKAARRRFERALRDAETLQDMATTARIFSHLGACVQDNAPAAIRYLVRALMLYDDLKLTSDVPLTLSRLANTLADARDLDEARSRMHAIAQTFLDANRPEQAAWVQLQIVEALAMGSGHEDRACALASELLRTFAGAGMADQAMRALEYVAGVAEDRALVSEHAHEAAKFFRRLRDDPRAVFVA